MASHSQPTGSTSAAADNASQGLPEAHAVAITFTAAFKKDVNMPGRRAIGSVLVYIDARTTLPGLLAALHQSMREGRFQAPVPQINAPKFNIRDFNYEDGDLNARLYGEPQLRYKQIRTDEGLTDVFTKMHERGWQPLDVFEVSLSKIKVSVWAWKFKRRFWKARNSGKDWSLGKSDVEWRERDEVGLWEEYPWVPIAGDHPQADG